MVSSPFFALSSVICSERINFNCPHKVFRCGFRKFALMHNGSSFFRRYRLSQKNLIIINLIVWLAMFVLPGRLGTGLENFGGLHYFLASDFNPAQLITYMFMHSTQSFAHIFFNMFSLWMFGMTLERTLGSARFLFYYVSCGVGAALVQELVWALTWEDTMVGLLAKYNAIDFPEAREYIRHLMLTPDGKAAIAQNLNMFVTIGASGAALWHTACIRHALSKRTALYVLYPRTDKGKVDGYRHGRGGNSHRPERGSRKSRRHRAFRTPRRHDFRISIILYWKKKGTFHGSY